MFKKTMLVFAVLLLTQTANAANKNVNDVKIQLLSAKHNQSIILVQTNPVPAIHDMTCTNDYWLILEKGTENFKEIYSMLMAAQAGNMTVDISIDDALSPTSPHCRLLRVVLKAN